MYIYGSFRFDLLCSLPVYYIALAFQSDMRAVVMWRLVQSLRMWRFTLYLDYVMEALSEYANIRVSTAMLRIFQMFLLVILLCHWFGCYYFYLALKGGEINMDEEDKSWVMMDDKDNSTDTSVLYLRGFYWSLYTVTTIGYGSVPCNRVTERLFSMFVMAVGAIICDAGITAVLSSYISNKDYQAGTNNRRIKCCKRFMMSGFVEQEIQTRILNFYSYADSELSNLDESEILGDVSVSVSQSILHHFCYDSLRKSSYLSTMKDGGVSSLVHTMKPYIAVPGEKIIEIGVENVQVYILQRGRCVSKDSTGVHSEVVAQGALFGHMATKANFDENGPLNVGVEVTFHDVKHLSRTSGAGDPYILMTCGYKACRSSVKKTKLFNETFQMKLNHTGKHTEEHGGTATKCTLSVMGWKKSKAHSCFGSCEIDLTTVEQNVKRSYPIVTESGAKAGVVSCTLRYFDLKQHDIADKHEVTVEAQSYCHLYYLECHKVESLIAYYRNCKVPELSKRLPPQLEAQNLYAEMCQSDSENNFAWRRPTRPILGVSANDLLMEDRTKGSFRELMTPTNAHLARGFSADALLEEDEDGMDTSERASSSKRSMRPSKEDVDAMTRRIRRRSSIAPSDINRVTTMVEGANGNMEEQAVRTLRKSGWTGSGRIKPPTMLSGTSSNNSSKVSVDGTPARDRGDSLDDEIDRTGIPRKTSGISFANFLPSKEEMEEMRNSEGMDVIRSRLESIEADEFEDEVEETSNAADLEDVIALSTSGAVKPSGGRVGFNLELPPVKPSLSFKPFNPDAPRGKKIPPMLGKTPSGRSLLRRRSSSGEHLVMRAKNKAPMLIKDWDNVVTSPGLEYEKKKRTSFFIEWEEKGTKHH
jgi:hypothetical protein